MNALSLELLMQVPKLAGCLYVAGASQRATTKPMVAHRIEIWWIPRPLISSAWHVSIDPSW